MILPLSPPGLAFTSVGGLPDLIRACISNSQSVMNTISLFHPGLVLATLSVFISVITYPFMKSGKIQVLKNQKEKKSKEKVNTSKMRGTNSNYELLDLMPESPPGDWRVKE